MRILHISDFHIDSDSQEDLKNSIIIPLINDITEMNNITPFDLVAFSGDLVDKGGKSFDGDIELAFLAFKDMVIEPIMAALQLPEDRFFFVPGNHDVDYDADTPFIESGLKNNLTTNDKVNAFIDSNSTEGRQRILPFKKFEKDYYNQFAGQAFHTDYQTVFKLSLGQDTIGVTCFNSSWRCYKEEESIVLGERQITRARDVINDCDIKIGIMHHPLDHLPAFEVKQIESMLLKDYDLLLFGHVHEGSNWSKTALSGSTVISASPSNWTTNIRSTNINFLNGYSIIDFHKGEHAKISNRKYSYFKEKYVPNSDLGDDYGVMYFPFPTSDEMAIKDSERSIIEKIKEVHLQTIDQHLISFDTDTNAPKKIDELFVMPSLISHEEEREHVDDEVYNAKKIHYTLSEICSTDSNLLLFGEKESGKTILMDKLLIEFTKNYTKYKKIPIYVDYNDSRQLSQIETYVSKFLNIGIKEIKNEILHKHEIVLLLDNLAFKSRHMVTEIEKFIEEHPNVKIIATCTTQGEKEIPGEAYNYNLLEKFKVIFIENFRAREIRELMRNWFVNSTAFEEGSSNFEKLILTFRTLNISRTPLAVSMFLWIIEKQDNFTPLNNSQMLENFLERVFTKTSASRIYSSDFNYKNKERLLTEIAYFMFIGKEDMYYRVKHNELLEFITANLKLKKFDFDDEALLKEFIDKGILKVEKEGVYKYVRFKFTCFFRFFLMKNIDINSEFHDRVMSEEEFLYFIDELDYYSGLKTDAAQLLEKTVSRMHKEYENVLELIEEEQYSYDNIFESLSTIVRFDKEEDLKKIANENKKTEEEIEQESDRHLDNTKIDQVEKKDYEFELDPITRFERLWLLSARVLKNTEEVSIENLKTNAYKKIVKCSMAYSWIHKVLIDQYFEKQRKDNTDSDEFIDQLEILTKLVPLFNQFSVYQALGTGKLKLVIQEEIDDMFKPDNNSSDFEKFMSVFIYADLRGSGWLQNIKALLKTVKRRYIKDMIYIKLREYYRQNNLTKNQEDQILNLIGDLFTLEDGNTQKRDFHRKGRIIAKIEKSKQERNRSLQIAE
ncbi:metallophosphoesterase [Alkalihalobacillus sp. NPDC078783]